jgi:hypothetical protein
MITLPGFGTRPQNGRLPRWRPSIDAGQDRQLDMERVPESGVSAAVQPFTV